MLRQQIFEAVEALRQRKCRPDRETIAHHIAKKHGIQFPDVFTELENIVDQGGLLKVEYKGSTSYRNPDQLESNSSPLLTKHSKILNSSRTSRLVITAITELLNEHLDWNTFGIPQNDLEAKLVSYDADRFNSNVMQTILEREISVGNILVSKKTGRMFPKDLFPKDDEINEVEQTTTTPTKKTGAGGGGGGSGGKRGKTATAKKSDASSTSLPATRSSANNQAGNSSGDVKDVQEKVAAAVRKTYGYTKAASAQPNSPSVSPGTATDTSTASTPPISSNTTTAAAASSTKPERHSARNKRKKEVFDPSDLPPPSNKKAANASSLNTCKTCTKVFVKAEEFLTCTNCNNNYHSSCVKEPPQQRQQQKKTTRRSLSLALTTTNNWICSSCKEECDVCGGGSGNKKLGEEELVEYSCMKCNTIVVFHPNCIESSNTEDKKCAKCMIGVIEPVNKQHQQQQRGTTTTPQTRGAKGRAATTTPSPVPAITVKKSNRGRKTATAKGKEEVKSEPEPEPEVTMEETDEHSTTDDEKNKSQNGGAGETGDGQEESTAITVTPIPDPDPTPVPAEVEKEEEKMFTEEEEAAVPASDPPKPSITPADDKQEVKADTNAISACAVEADSLDTGEKSKSNGTASASTDTINDIDKNSTAITAAASALVVVPPEKPPQPAAVVVVPPPDPKQAADWSPKEVEAYFHSKGMKEEGTVLREQEIDGVALLLMKRSDITHGMNFLLGPGVKIYREIMELQKIC